MSAIRALLRSNKYVNVAEFAARLYPDQERRVARTTLYRKLRLPTYTRDFRLALSGLFQAFTAYLRQGLDHAATVPDHQLSQALVAIADDPRLVDVHFARFVFPDHASGTAHRYWLEAKRKTRQFTYPQCCLLHLALKTLTEQCEEALK